MYGTVTATPQEICPIERQNWSINPISFISVCNRTEFCSFLQKLKKNFGNPKAEFSRSKNLTTVAPGFKLRESGGKQKRNGNYIYYFYVGHEANISSL